MEVAPTKLRTEMVPCSGPRAAAQSQACTAGILYNGHTRSDRQPVIMEGCSGERRRREAFDRHQVPRPTLNQCMRLATVGLGADAEEVARRACLNCNLAAQVALSHKQSSYALVSGWKVADKSHLAEPLP